MKNFKKIILPNGLRVVLVPQPAALAATVLVLVEAGSEYETKDINGVSHFLEHMVFKGTRTRSKPGMIALELDSMGAEYNAFTSQEYTGYWAKARNRNVHQILDLVADMYLNPIFNPQEIEKERGVIIEEINLNEDTPMRRISSLFHELLYGNQPAGWEVAGSKEIIRSLQQKDFIAYRDKHYIASATVVTVAGAFDEKKVLAQIKKDFGSLPRTRKVVKVKTKDAQKNSALLLRHKESDQSHLILGVRAFDIFDKRREALGVLAGVLGGGMSSRLFHRIREELGAAYYVHAYADPAYDHGIFAVGAGVDHTKIELVLKAVLNEFDVLKTKTVGTAELNKVKEHLIGGLVLGMETSDELASFYGGQEIVQGSIQSAEDHIKKIKAVTAAQIQAVARSIFKEHQLNLAVIGPYKTSEKLSKLINA